MEVFMIDTHCHLFNQDYEELDKLLFELDNDTIIIHFILLYIKVKYFIVLIIYAYKFILYK